MKAQPDSQNQFQNLQSSVEKSEDSTVTVNVTIPKELVQAAYQKVLIKAAQKTEIKGFRKGKAPNNLVEKRIGKEKLYRDTIQHLFPELLVEIINRHKLKPISSPKFDLLKAQEEEDWGLKITLAEKPEITLGDYKKIIFSTKSSSKIWVPGKDITEDSQSNDQKKKSREELLAKILDALIDNLKFPVSIILIEDEVTHQLSQLLNQLQKLGLTIEQYLTSLNKTIDQLKQEYRESAERSLRIELILNEIANDLNVKVEDTEVESLIASLGDENLKHKLQSPQEKVGIRTTLRKSKVLDELLKI